MADRIGGGTNGAPARPAVAPELASLPGEAHRIWTEPEARQEALERMLLAWERGDPAAAEHVRRMDDAVVAGLAALGLPRGPIRSIRIDSVQRPWAGRKQPDCRLVLNGDVLHHLLHVQQRPDDVLRPALRLVPAG